VEVKESPAVEELRLTSAKRTIARLRKLR